MNKDIYSAGEVAGICGINTKTVLRAIRHGELTAHKYGPRNIRITSKAVEAWQVLCQLRAMSVKGQSAA